jgi:hypothetical protein
MKRFDSVLLNQFDNPLKPRAHVSGQILDFSFDSTVEEFHTPSHAL